MSTFVEFSLFMGHVFAIILIKNELWDVCERIFLEKSLSQIAARNVRIVHYGFMEIDMAFSEIFNLNLALIAVQTFEFFLLSHL